MKRFLHYLICSPTVEQTISPLSWAGAFCLHDDPVLYLTWQQMSSSPQDEFGNRGPPLRKATWLGRPEGMAEDRVKWLNEWGPLLCCCAAALLILPNLVSFGTELSLSLFCLFTFSPLFLILDRSAVWLNGTWLGPGRCWRVSVCAVWELWCEAVCTWGTSCVNWLFLCSARAAPRPTWLRW